jgi:hypothetical protein
LTQIFGTLREKRLKPNKLRHPAPGAPANKMAHLTGFLDENGQKRRCLFRSVPLGRAQSGTKMGKIAHICPSLSQSNALTLGQTSPNLELIREKCEKSLFLFHTVPPARAQIGTNIAVFGLVAMRASLKN